MRLREKQSQFVQMLAKLYQFAADNGYELTLGDAYRDPRCPYGSKNSNHHIRLAQDLNLFLDGKYLKGKQATRHHNFLHDYWDSIGGAPRIKDDLNHYSLEHNGRR